jgi:hypothetical protein
MPSMNEAEEGRVWDLILPEIVSTGTNDDDIPGRGRSGAFRASLQGHGPHF